MTLGAAPGFLSPLPVPAFLLHWRKWLFLLPMFPTIFFLTNISAIMVDNPCYKKVDFFIYPDRLGILHFGFEAVVSFFAPSSQSTGGNISHLPFLWRSPDSLKSPVHPDFSEGFCSVRRGLGAVCHDCHGNTLPGGSWAALPGRGSSSQVCVPQGGGIRRQDCPGNRSGLSQQGSAGVPSQEAHSQVDEAGESTLMDRVSLTQGLIRAAHVGRSLPSLHSIYSLVTWTVLGCRLLLPLQMKGSKLHHSLCQYIPNLRAH